MSAMTGGVTKAGTGVDGIVWNILGQTLRAEAGLRKLLFLARHVPARHLRSAAHSSDPGRIHLHARGTDRPGHEGREFIATAGDLIRLPMTIPHGLFNKSDQTIKCFFWVTPTRKLYDLFWAIHSMKEQTPPEVVALSAKHEVMFLPPPE